MFILSILGGKKKITKATPTLKIVVSSSVQVGQLS